MDKKTLKDQILFANEMTTNLIKDISEEAWFYTPEVVKTNVNWQLGHIISANNFFGVNSIKNMEGSESVIDAGTYFKHYGPNSVPADAQQEKPSSKQLCQDFEALTKSILHLVDDLQEADLENETAIPNPVAKTKYEALRRMAHHQSWHNGQLGVLKRILKNEGKL